MNTEFKVIDLTHPLSSEVPSWNGDKEGFSLKIDTDYPDCTPPDLFRTQVINSRAGMGTHIDAPAHVVPGGRTVDQLSIDELVVDCIVIDVSSVCTESLIIQPSAVLDFEKVHGVIPKDSFVIFYTGWSKRWDKALEYHSNHVFPSVDLSTAELLLERGIAGIGIDTFSTDTGSRGFPVHRAILGADKYLVENIANADKLPSKGSKIFIMPINIKGATEAPLRIIALI